MGALITNGVIFSKDNPAESQIGVQSGSNKMYMYNKNGTDVGIWYSDDDTGYVIRIHDGTRTFHGNLIGNASNSDKLDGFHEYSFLRYRGEASVNEENTLWDQIGIKEYANKYPSGAMQKYGWGHVISLPSANGRLDLYATHYSSEQSYNGLQYRTGWTTNAQPWRMILDSGNFNGYVPSLTGTGASGTWGINISGNAATASKWVTGRTFTIGGTAKSVDGSSNVSWSIDEIGVPYVYHTGPGFSAYGNWGMMISSTRNTYGESGKADNYYIATDASNNLRTGHQLNGTADITWTDILNERNYSSYALPLSGGTMSGSPVIKFPASAGSIAASDPMAITYGRISAYGTLCINADSDGSTNEYLILTSGRGLSGSTADGLAIGYNTLTWQGATVITSANYTSYCAPASHSHNYATLGAPNNLMHSGNEFTFAPAGYSGGVWFNFRTAGWDTNGNITEYNFGNGKGGLAPAVAQYFRTTNYGSGAPGSSTPGYGSSGAIYYQV